MNSITKKDLEAVCNRINLITKNPLTPYENVNGKHTAQIGNYHLSGAYGGYSLHQMQNEGGGISDVLGCGYITKRDLYNRMQAFINGLQKNS